MMSPELPNGFKQASLNFPIDRCVNETGIGWKNAFESLQDIYENTYVNEFYDIGYVKEKFGSLRMSWKLRYTPSSSVPASSVMASLDNSLPALPLVSHFSSEDIKAWLDYKKASSQFMSMNYKEWEKDTNKTKQCLDEIFVAMLRLYKTNQSLFLIDKFKSHVGTVSDLTSHICMTCGGVGVIGHHKKDSGYISAACAKCSQTSISNEEKLSAPHFEIKKLDKDNLELFLFIEKIKKYPKLFGLISSTEDPTFDFSPEKLLLASSETRQEVLLTYFNMNLSLESKSYYSVEELFHDYLFCYHMAQSSLKYKNSNINIHPIMALLALPSTENMFLNALQPEGREPIKYFDLVETLEMLNIKDKLNIPECIDFLSTMIYQESHNNQQNSFTGVNKEEIIKNLKSVLSILSTHAEKELFTISLDSRNTYNEPTIKTSLRKI